MAKSMTQVFCHAVPMALYDRSEHVVLMNANVSMEHAPVTFSTRASVMSVGQVSYAISKVAISRVKTAGKLSSMGLANAIVPVQPIWPAITAK